MKAGWITSTLGDMCDMYQPKTISVKEMDKDGYYPVFGANGVIGRYNQFNHEEPQLLITCRGATCGSVNISEPKSWITGNAMVVRPKNGAIEMRFLEYLFRGGLDISKAITGAAQPQITRTNLNPLKITFPAAIEEQQRIVGILDEAFAGIAIAKANAEKNMQNARALFESYLEAVFAEHGQEWTKKPLGEICSLITDGKHGDCRNEEGSGYYFLSAKDVKQNTLNFENARQITEVDFKETHRRTNLKPYDICMVNTGATIGKLALAPNDPRTLRTTFQKSVAIIKPIPSVIDNFYCFYHLKADLAKLVNVSSGAAQKNLLLDSGEKGRVQRKK